MSWENSNSDSTTDPDRSSAGRVRWRRFAAMMLGAGAVAATLVVLTAQGALAAQFVSISGIPFTVTSSHLHGDGFEQFGTIDNLPDGSPWIKSTVNGQSGKQRFVIVSAIHSAELNDLCQSISMGGMYLKLTAGSPQKHVIASDLIVDSDMLSGDLAKFDHIDIGQDASTLDTVPGGTNQLGSHALGNFGQQAKTIDIDGLRQSNYATTAASFTLPNLSMSISDTGC